jgi:hypothetical protein
MMERSASGAGEAAAAPPRASSFFVLDRAAVCPRPLDDYGYVAGGVLVPADRDALLALCLGPHRPAGVWTPATEGVVPPWEVTWIFERMTAPARRAAYRRVRITAGIVAIWGVLTVVGLAWGPRALRFGPPLLFALSAVWLVRALKALRSARRLRPHEYAARLQPRLSPP